MLLVLDALVYVVAMSAFARLPVSVGQAFRASVFALALFSSGCGVALLDQRVEGEAKEWHLAVTKILDGPDETIYGPYRMMAGPGHRFLHVYVALKNLGDHTRSWNWRRCGLDHGSDEYLPVLAVPVKMTYAPMDEKLKDNVFRGEEIERRLVVNYPAVDTLPTRLKCGDIVLPLRLKQ